MIPSRYMAILKTASATAFLVSFSAFAVLPPKIAALLLNMAIIFSWLGFGSMTGAIFLALSSLGTLVLSRGQGHMPIVPIGSFAAAGVIGYLYRAKFETQDRALSLKADKVKEGINLLLDGIKNKGLDIESTRKKLARYATLKEVAESLGTTLSGEAISALVIYSAMRIDRKST